MEEFLPEKYTAPGFLDFFVAYEQNYWLPENISEKNYLPGKESSVFLTLKIEESLPEK